MKMCCCCFRGRAGVYAVALVDVLIGFLTAMATLLPLVYSIKISDTVWTEADYVKWFGLISIFLVAFIEIFSGCCLFSSLSRGKLPKSYFWKSIIYFLSEIAGFVAPFFFVKNYTENIDNLMNANSHLFMLYLLKLNPLTIILFVYQLYSFSVVHNYGVTKRKELKEAMRKLKKCKDIPLLPLTSTSNPPQTPTAVAVDISNSPSAPGKNCLYPSLSELELENDDDVLLNILVCNSKSRGNNSKIVKARYNPKLGMKKLESEFEKKKSNCLRNKTLYVDPEFPACDKTLGMETGIRRVQWKRPFEINPNAQFFVDGISRFDVKQGELGNCWFVASLANITLREDLFNEIVPEDNDVDFSDRNEYAGIFHFRFNVGGIWKNIIIDDLLPTKNGKLIFIHSNEPTEFWSSLVEKAYAKLKGSYGKLDGGNMSTAFSDFTGKPSEKIHLKTIASDQIFNMMKSCIDAGNLIGAAVLSDSFRKEGMGIYASHAYSITGVQDVKLIAGPGPGRIKLVRVRNPWGTKNEWTGDWSDGHPLWKQVDKTTKQKLKIIFEEDGEFWFPFSKFKKFFDMIEICYVA